jgi:hypothetical protein
MRDLFLIARFVEAVGSSFRDSEVRPADHPRMRLAAQLVPAIEAIAQRMEAELPPEPVEDPR